MKKIITLAALVALAFGPAAAETIIPGSSSLTSGSATSSSSSSLPIYFDGNDADGSTYYSVSQSIFPASLLTKIAPSTAANGASSVSKISAVSFVLAEGSCYIDSGTLDIDCWIQNVESEEFTKVNNKLQWNPYTDGVKGHVSLDGEEFNYGSDVTVTITFSTPLEYTGKGLQLTFDATCDFLDYYVGWFGGTYTVNPYVGHVCSGLDNGSSSLSMKGNIPFTSNLLPIVEFTYETETTEPVPSEPVRGEAADALVGNYNNPNTGGESIGAVIPFDSDYEYSYCQALYTPDMLTALNQPVDGNPSKSEINELTFKMLLDYAYLEGQKSFTVYVQNIDALTFPVVNNTPQWFTVDTSISGTAQTEEYYLDEVEGEQEYTIKLDTPILYEGKSLLVTWLSEGHIEDLFSNKFESQVFTASDGKIHSGIYSSDSSIGIQSGALKNSSKNLPVLKLGYTPLIEQGGAKPVAIENVEIKLESVGVTGNYSYANANSVTVTFDVNDPTNCGEYEIFNGTQSLGTINGTSGTIRYIPVTKFDMILKIEPKGEGAFGTNYTVAADEIAALFPVPTAVATGEYALYSSYDIFNNMEGSLQGAAQFKVTTTVPVARMTAGSVVPTNAQLMNNSSSYPANIAALRPAVSDYNYVAPTNGIMGVYASNLGTGRLVNDVMQWPSSVSISAKPQCIYPVVSTTIPVLSTGKDALAANTTVSGTVATIEKACANSISVAMAVNADHFVDDASYPEKMRCKEDQRGGTLQFFAPKGWTMEYKFVAGLSRSDSDWEAVSTNPWTYKIESNNPGVLTVRATNPNDSADVQEQTYTISDEGVATGLTEIGVTSTEKVEIYNLQGRRLAAPVKGINIINGKKVIL